VGAIFALILCRRTSGLAAFGLFSAATIRKGAVMKRIFTYLAAASLAVSGIGLAVQADGKVKDALDSGKHVGDKLQDIGNTQADETTATAARVLLTKAVNDGLTEGRFMNLVENLAKSDRERVGDFKPPPGPKMDDLNKAIAQFRTDFKAKYNQDFEIRPEHFRDAIVYAGRDKNSATVQLPELKYDRAAESSKLNSQLNEKVTGKKLEAKAGDLAKTAVGEPKAGSSLTVNLLNEGTARGSWRINIPNEITGDQLKGNLIKHIQMLDDQKAMWPADADEAYHAAAYHVLQAMNDSALASDR
jgi:hypothetical protein